MGSIGITPHNVGNAETPMAHSPRTTGGKNRNFQCEGITKKGTRCLIRVEASGAYCSYHGPFQCTALTKAGTRCKVRVDARNGLCKHHSSSHWSKTQVSPSAVPKANTKGFIYVYTIDKGHNNLHVFDAAKNRTVPLKQSEHGLFCRLKAALQCRAPPERSILVKVGFTTKDPKRRLNEWRQKCQHPVHLIGPPPTTRDAGYSHDDLGWPCMRANEAEARIHEQLGAIFGRGSTECHGCKTEKGPGKHREWFLVPGSSISQVFGIICYWVAVCNTRPGKV